MKNKILVCAVIMLVAVSVSHAMNWGTEVSGSLWTMDGTEFKKDMVREKTSNMFSGATLSLKQNKLGGAFSIFTESEKELSFGAAFGFGLMPQVSYKISGIIGITDFNLKFTNETSHIPVNIYLKYKPKDAGYSIFGGIGADYVMAKTDLSETISHSAERVSGSGSFTQKKVVPYVKAGGEYFITKWLSLNAGVEYLFSGNMDNLTGNYTCTDRGRLRKRKKSYAKDWPTALIRKTPKLCDSPPNGRPPSGSLFAKVCRKIISL